MNEREQRGLAIAAVSRIRNKGGAWLVPSQTGSGIYTVVPDPEHPHCTCPDHETRGVKVVAHNICCIIQEMHESGVDPTFWAEMPVAQKLSNNPTF